MRVLLDANVWRRGSDAGAGGRLANLATEKGLRIVVAPSVIYEALRCSDAQLRRRLVGLLVRQEWKRLMPEAYSESMELRGEIGAPPAMLEASRRRSVEFREAPHGLVVPGGGILVTSTRSIR